MMVSTWLMGLLTVYLGAYIYSKRKVHPQEPPVVVSPVPFIGHVLSMVLLGSRYIKNLGLRHRSREIFTLPLPGSRMYIVTSPPLATQVQRASRALSFTPLIPDITERVFGLDAHTMRIVRRNLDPAPGEEKGFLADIQELVYAELAMGGAGGREGERGCLEELTMAAVEELRGEVGVLVEEVRRANQTDDMFGRAARGDGVEIDLLEWLQRTVASGTAKYLYGEDSPLALDPSLVEAFWDFDHGLGGLLLGLWPRMTASKAYKGREKLCAGFVEYLNAGRHLQDKTDDEGRRGPSSIIQKRIELALKHDWTLEMIARSELSFLFAGIVNATTATFWIVLRLFADRDLLGLVRSEIESTLTPGANTSLKSVDGSGQSSTVTQVTLSIPALRDNCPLLIAVYRECLRLGSDNASTRLVKQDTMLGDRYFLRAGSVVQIAGGTIHADDTIWGDDVDEFNPQRFLATTSTSTASGVEEEEEGNTQKQQQKKQKYHPAAFRAFGGGKTICPGRHFAMDEILTLVALIVLQFDMTATNPDGRGEEQKIKVPSKNDSVLPVHILEPTEAVKLRVRLRVKEADSRQGLAESDDVVGDREKWGDDVLSNVRFSMAKTY